MNNQEFNITPNVSSIDNKIITVDKLTNSRFIVYLDIMGFKDRISRNTHEDVLRTLTIFTSLISEIKNRPDYSSIKQSQFSDSIILFSNGDSIDDLKLISEVTKEIIRAAIKNAIPIRGALACGLLTVDMTKNLFFGRPLVDAYELEEKGIKYYGVIVHNSAEVKVKIVCEDNATLYKNIKAPLKCGNVEHYELNWYFDYNECIKYLEVIKESVSGEPRVYIDNTVKVLDTYYKM